MLNKIFKGLQYIGDILIMLLLAIGSVFLCERKGKQEDETAQEVDEKVHDMPMPDVYNSVNKSSS